MFIENNIHQNTVLNGILEHIKKIRAYTIYGRMYVLPVKYIQKNPHYYDQLQINTDTHFNAIIMDVDNEDLLAEWNDVGLPVPTIQTLNADNNKAHLIWVLNHPVSKTNKKAVAYYRDIVKSIQILIGADQNYQNHQTKNFFNDAAYRVIYNDVAYDLAEFHDFVIDHRQSSDSDTAISASKASTSRHITLFNQLRHYGYTIARNKNLHMLLEHKAHQINQQFEVPIKPRSIVKSVYEFCHANRKNFRSKAKEKPMGFSQIKNLSREEFLEEVSLRQSLAAKRTTQMKIADTLRNIMAAVKFMQRTGSKITLLAIANSSKKSLSTVKRYGKWIKKFIQKEAGLIRSIRVLASGGEERAVSIPLRGNYELKRIAQCSENYSWKTHSSQNREGGNLYVIEY